MVNIRFSANALWFLIAAVSSAAVADPSSITCKALEDSSGPTTTTSYDNWCGVAQVLQFDNDEAAKLFLEDKGLDDAFRDGKTIFLEQPLANEHSNGPLTHPNDTHGDFVPGAISLDPRDELYGLQEFYSTTDLATADDNLRKVNDLVLEKIGVDPKRPIKSVRELKVAVLDTGVFDHPEFRRPDTNGSSIVRWYDADPSVIGIECEGGECCKQIESPLAESSHGTQVAGLIAANDDRIGISGFGNVSELMSIRVTQAKPRCFSRRRLVAAVHCALEKRANVINISMQSARGRKRPNDLLEAVSLQTDESTGGRPLFVLAAGNKDCDLCKKDCSVWPATMNLPWVVTVGAVNFDLKRTGSSNYGQIVDLVVPAPSGAERLCTTMPDSEFDPQTTKCAKGYGNFHKTSAAAAIASAAATRVWSHPNFEKCSAEQIRNAMRGYGRKLPASGEESCLLQIDFLYDVRFKDNGDYSNLCNCPELAETEVTCGEFRQQKPLCGDRTTVRQP